MNDQPKRPWREVVAEWIKILADTELPGGEEKKAAYLRKHPELLRSNVITVTDTVGRVEQAANALESVQRAIELEAAGQFELAAEQVAELRQQPLAWAGKNELERRAAVAAAVADRQRSRSDPSKRRKVLRNDEAVKIYKAAIAAGRTTAEARAEVEGAGIPWSDTIKRRINRDKKRKLG